MWMWLFRKQAPAPDTVSSAAVREQMIAANEMLELINSKLITLFNERQAFTDATHQMNTLVKMAETGPFAALKLWTENAVDAGRRYRKDVDQLLHRWHDHAADLRSQITDLKAENDRLRIELSTVRIELANARYAAGAPIEGRDGDGFTGRYTDEVIKQIREAEHPAHPDPQPQEQPWAATSV